MSLTIPITLPSQTSVHFLSPLLHLGKHDGPSTSSTAHPIVHPELSISHLPAITARIVLPDAYPLELPAKVLSLRAGLSAEERSNWLPRSALQAVQDKLRAMWAEEKESMGEGAGVLWRWWEWVGTGEFLVDLGLMDGSDLR